MVSPSNFDGYEARPEGMIHDAQYDYYGKRLATCSTDGNIDVYDVSKADVSKGDNVPRLWGQKGHHGPVWQISWAHPKFGNIFATCSFDKKVIVWKEVRLNEWQEVVSYEHQASVNAIAWMPQECGLKLAACSADGYVSLLSKKGEDSWEKPIKFQAHELGVNALSWAPLPVSDDVFGEFSPTKSEHFPKLTTGSCDKTVKIWEYRPNDANPFVEVAVFKDHTDWVRDVTFCPSIGAPYDVLDHHLFFYRNDKPGSIKFEIIAKVKHEGPVWRLSWSFGGNMLAVSSATEDAENVVDVYRETEQGEWKKISRIQDDTLISTK